MRYESEKSAKGNVGVSYVSQSEADEQAKEMDKNNCTYCISCTYCRNCSDCSDCSGCSDCSDCISCSMVGLSRTFAITHSGMPTKR